jgi:phytoene synthase
VVARLLDEADRYYASAAVGLRALRFRSAWAIATALGVYRDIGRVVRSRGTAAWDERAVVGTARKLWFVATGAVRAAQARSVERRAAGAPRAEDLWITPDLAAKD